MAQAKVITTNVPVTTYKEVKSVTLELSLEEAVLLRSLVARVGGAPEDTARGLSDGISEALRTAGITGWVSGCLTGTGLQGGITCHKDSLQYVKGLVSGMEL